MLIQQDTSAKSRFPSPDREISLRPQEKWKAHDYPGRLLCHPGIITKSQINLRCYGKLKGNDILFGSILHVWTFTVDWIYPA